MLMDPTMHGGNFPVVSLSNFSSMQAPPTTRGSVHDPPMNAKNQSQTTPRNDRQPNTVRYLLYLALTAAPSAYLGWIIPQLLSTISMLGQSPTDAARDNNFFDPTDDSGSAALPSTFTLQQQQPFLTGTQRGDSHVYLSTLCIWLALTSVLVIGAGVVAYLELARRTPRQGFGFRTFVCGVAILFMLTEIFVNVAIPKRVTGMDNVAFLVVHLGKDCVLIILSFLWQFTLPDSSPYRSASRAVLDDRESSRSRTLSTGSSSLNRSSPTTPPTTQPPSPPQAASLGRVRTSLAQTLSTRSKRDSTLLVRPTSLVGVPGLPTAGAGEHLMSLPRVSESQGSGGREESGNEV